MPLILADTLMAVTEAPGTLLILSDDFEDSHVNLLQRFTTKQRQQSLFCP
jgi:Ca-activated chloride channel family protein